METTLISGGKFPAHDLGVRADEKVRERHGRNRNVGLGHPPLPIPAVCLGTHIGRGCGHIENLDAPTAYPVGGSRRVRVANTNLGQTHRIDGGAVTRNSVGDRFSCPIAKRRVRVEGVDEYVGVQKDHGSRVISRSFSHVSVGLQWSLAHSFHTCLFAHSFGYVSGFSSRSTGNALPPVVGCRRHPLAGRPAGQSFF